MNDRPSSKIYKGRDRSVWVTSAYMMSKLIKTVLGTMGIPYSAFFGFRPGNTFTTLCETWCESVRLHFHFITFDDRCTGN